MEMSVIKIFFIASFVGLAYVGGACKWRSRTVILADKGGYGAVLPAAHEIGHR